VKEEIKVSYITFLAGTAALGGLLFGFDIAIIAGAGPFLAQHFQLNDLQLGWGFSSLLFGCVLGSAVAGRLADRYGRRKLLLVVAALFAITSIGTGLASSFTNFVIARLLGGLAVGAVSLVSPMYISEVAPPSLRGRLGACYQLSIVTGAVASYFINYLLRNIGPHNWRWMFISGALPSAIFFALLLLAPETPRYLIKAGEREKAFNVLMRIAGPEKAEFQVAEIVSSLTSKRASWLELMRPGLRRAVWVSFALAILVQVSGINTVIDYAPVIFRSAGSGLDAALFSTFVLGIGNFLFTLVSLRFIDRHGRKPLYIVGSLGMTVALLLLAAAVVVGHFRGIVVLALILTYLAFFESCIGPVFWTVVPEIFPNNIRGTAMTVPVLTQWVANALVVLFFPAAFNSFSKASVFGFLAVMALLQAICAWRLLPETKNKSLEEIEKLWRPTATTDA
jgi:MFS transporter, SP family, arabinose:H+ symporter